VNHFMLSKKIVTFRDLLTAQLNVMHKYARLNRGTAKFDHF